MPKMKTFFACCTTAIIAFTVGLNISQYPIVWEIIGTAANLVQRQNHQQIEALSQKPSTEPSIAATTTAAAANKSNNYAAIPAKQEPAATSSWKNAEQAEASEQSDGFSTKIATTDQQAAHANTATTELVPVPENLLLVTGPKRIEHSFPATQRLPPVGRTIAIAPGQYAERYTQGPIPIYPSTGE
ncbi:MAG: hypothetical protein ACWGMZ_03510 [Thermoguttaceae bacterium]